MTLSWVDNYVSLQSDWADEYSSQRYSVHPKRKQVLLDCNKRFLLFSVDKKKLKESQWITFDEAPPIFKLGFNGEEGKAE